MKPKYIGTKLDDPDYLEFGITAAKLGTSKSALLKSLVVEFINNSKDNTPDGGGRKSKTKKAA